MSPSPSSPQDLLAQAQADLESAVQGSLARERAGGLDAAAQARLEVQLEARFQAFTRQMDARIAHAQAPEPPPAPRTRAVLFSNAVCCALVLFMLGGLLLEGTLGRGFIMAGDAAYSALLPWVVAGLMPPIAALLVLLSWSRHRLRQQWRTGGVRWLANMLLATALFALVLAVAPWGWTALLGQMAGVPSRAEAMVVSIDKPSGRHLRHCDEGARLRLAGDEATLCLTGRLAGAGAQVLLTGRRSRWGMHIDRIDPLDESRPGPVKTGG